VTHTQLLEKVKTFTDAQEGNNALRAGGVNFILPCFAEDKIITIYPVHAIENKICI